MLIREFEGGRHLLATLEHGAEIIGQITRVIRENDIRAGHLNVIGALDQAEIGYYDQVSHSYQGIQINEPVELASCSGNISLLAGQPYSCRPLRHEGKGLGGAPDLGPDLCRRAVCSGACRTGSDKI